MPEPVRDAMRLQGVEPLEEKERRRQILACRIPVEGGENVGERVCKDALVIAHGFVDHVADEHRRQHGVVQLARQPER